MSLKRIPYLKEDTAEYLPDSRINIGDDIIDHDTVAEILKDQKVTRQKQTPSGGGLVNHA
ncbi:hypothetical protein [Peribacillus sp. NPDC058075]|uniref:hypothetical protein n=1 Tax=unclassified Peribacillus TaxID=2675266 RepID=UPI0036D8AB88